MQTTCRNYLVSDPLPRVSTPRLPLPTWRTSVKMYLCRVDEYFARMYFWALRVLSGPCRGQNRVWGSLEIDRLRMRLLMLVSHRVGSGIPGPLQQLLSLWLS